MTFKDVTNEHWAAKVIEEFASKGIVNGYKDGTFRPDEPITRAEAATILMRYKEIYG